MSRREGESPVSVWRVLVPLGIAVVLSLAGDQTLYATLASQTDVVGISVASVGIMLAVNRLVRIPGNPLGGVLVDRFGRRWPFLAGMFLGTLSTLAYPFAHGFWPLLGTRTLWGISWILINISGLSMVLDITVLENRGRITGVYQFAFLFGLSITAMAGGFLVDALGFHTALLICGGATAAGLLIALITLPETTPAIASGPSRESELVMLPARLMRHLRTMWAGFDRRIYAVTSMYFVARFAGHGVIMSTMGLLLAIRFGDVISVGQRVVGVAAMAGVLVGIGPLMGMIAGPIAGHISDSPRGRWRVIGAGFALGITGFALLVVDRWLWVIVAGRLVTSLADGILAPTMVSQAGDLAPAHREGAVMGLYAVGGDIGGTIGPILAYALAAVIDLSWVYLLCGILYAAALGLTWWASSWGKRPELART